VHPRVAQFSRTRGHLGSENAHRVVSSGRTVDGIIHTGGAARFKPWDQLTDEDWTFSLANKLLGQVNVVRYGLKSVRPGGAITLTTGLAAQYPARAARSSPPSTTPSKLLFAQWPQSHRFPCGSTPFHRLGLRNAAGDGAQSYGRHSDG
jgi:hypothetical protein